MKTMFLKILPGSITAFVAVSCFFIFSSLEKDDPKVAASQCCNGYVITNSTLQKFMLDSLNTIKFEGGVYSKADLLNAINALSSADDSISLLNVFVNCSVQQGTDIALTSRHSNGVRYVRQKKPCPDCPNKPCCRNTACVAMINRPCINYKVYQGTDLINDQITDPNTPATNK